MIITIDGPAGAGKSTVARRLAERLNFEFLDTGAMYRAVAWLSLEKEISPDAEEAFAQMLNDIDIEVEGDRIWINKIEVSDKIRSVSVTNRVAVIADQVLVRKRLVQEQREIAAAGNFVCEGRDQGTVVFPESPCKIYLTASAQERARRRAEELNRQGEVVTEKEILRQQQERDRRDETRPVGALAKAYDSVEVITDGLTLDQVVERLERVAREKLELN